MYDGLVVTPGDPVANRRERTIRSIGRNRELVYNRIIAPALDAVGDAYTRVINTPASAVLPVSVAQIPVVSGAAKTYDTVREVIRDVVTVASDAGWKNPVVDSVPPNPVDVGVVRPVSTTQTPFMVPSGGDVRPLPTYVNGHAVWHEEL